MAGPVPSYLETQTAAQSAFTVPFGLITYVNAVIAEAVAAGKFNATVNCSLFPESEVASLGAYISTLGYRVDASQMASHKALNIDWSLFRDAAGSATTVIQGTMPWVISGTVDIGDFPTVQPISAITLPLPVGAATEATLAEIRDDVGLSVGAWGYHAGVSGTIVVAPGQRVIGIGCHASGSGSFTINGGDSVPVPSVGININPAGNLVAPTIVFTGTDSFFVEVVS